MNKKIVSDLFIFETGNVRLKTWVWGNSRLNNTKPLFQVELQYKDGKIIWDKEYTEMPLTVSDKQEIENKLSLYTTKIERDGQVLKQLIHGELVMIEWLREFDINKLYEGILANSKQAINYLIHKITR